MPSEEVVFYVEGMEGPVIHPISGFQVYYVKPEHAGRIRIADYILTGSRHPEEGVNEVDKGVEFLIEYAPQN